MRFSVVFSQFLFFCFSILQRTMGMIRYRISKKKYRSSIVYEIQCCLGNLITFSVALVVAAAVATVAVEAQHRNGKILFLNSIAYIGVVVVLFFSSLIQSIFNIIPFPYTPGNLFRSLFFIICVYLALLLHHLNP